MPNGLMDVRFHPMPLARISQPFDHPDWLFELKYDGFRALAYVSRRGTKLVSRTNVEYGASWISPRSFRSR
jgi:bifunctional non-homologous end joining protein LigD